MKESVVRLQSSLINLFIEMQPWLNPVQLKASNVSLVPLEVSHLEGLLEAAADGKLWELWYTSVPSKDTISNYIQQALEEQAAGKSLPFTVLDATGKIIGSTRYCNAVPSNRRLEIGYTWYAQSYQRTGVNSTCKFLLLQHAFETLDCIAVEFCTHWFNRRSREAIARLGAHQDGVLRSHRLNPDGSVRDTVVFSIIKSEWPGVKQSLSYAMQR